MMNRLNRPFLATIAGIAVLGTAVGAYIIAAPGGGEEEVVQQQVETTTPSATAFLEMPTVTFSPLPAVTVAVPGAAIRGLITGPADAQPGQTLTYRVTFDVGDLKTAVLAVEWSDSTLQYASWSLVAGKASAVGDPRYLRWEIEGTGAFDLLVQVPQDKVAETFSVSAYVIGTGVGSEFQPASTTIRAP